MLPLLACTLVATPALASSFDNEAGVYVLTALPDAAREARRMDRMQLCDQQPAGRFLRKGESITITVDRLPPGFSLGAAVGFRPLWGVKRDQQRVPLTTGTTRFTANQDGPLFFRFIAPAGNDDARDEVDLNIDGGEPLPLFVDGEMDAQDWRDELGAHADAPFVQLIGEQAMITLPAKVHAQHPVADPPESFAAINQMLDLENELAGFDGTTRRDQPTRLRMHYLVDFRASKKDREGFYMYATDQFIGMLPDNTEDLTDPAKLRELWGIWHETGHTHQQNSWTWGALTEVNVNLFSLYVQEAFGQPGRLGTSEDEGSTTLQKARAYLTRGADDMLSEVAEDDGNGFFVRLVMFHQLRQAYGWELFKKLHKHFRAHPLADDASDQDKADAFVVSACDLTHADLRPFFEKWGLRASDAASERIARRNYPTPEADPAQIFE